MATTSVTININTPADITVAQVVDTVSTYWGYQTNIPDPANPGQTISNPQTRGQFVKARIAQFVKDSYIAARASQGADSGRTTATTDANRVAVD